MKWLSKIFKFTIFSGIYRHRLKHKLKFLLFSNYRNLAAQNLIDSTSNLENTKVYIAHGTQDSVVKPIYGQKILEFYQGLVTNANDIVPVFNISAEHGVISNRRGTPCGEMNLQTFVENCNEDTIKEMFNHVYSNMNNPKSDGDLSNTLKSFSQVSLLFFKSLLENYYQFQQRNLTYVII